MFSTSDLGDRFTTHNQTTLHSGEKYAIGSTNGYDWNKPVTQFELPKILQEISGLTDINDETIACVQDEDSIVFIYRSNNQF